MNTRSCVLLLEHTSGAAHVLESIRKLECDIIYVGKNKDIAGLCDQWLDYDLIHEIDLFISKEIDLLRRCKPIGVLAFMENSKHAEARILRGLNLQPNSVSVWEFFRKKNVFREVTTCLNLNTVKYEYISDPDKEHVPALDYPFIAKPSMGYASGGVFLVNNKDEFLKACHTIHRLNRFVFQNEGGNDAGIICEELIDGIEFAVDSITADGVTKVFSVCRRGFPDQGDFSDYTYFSSPEDLSKYSNELEILLTSLFKEVGFRNGATHSELRLCSKDNKFKLIEIGQRVGFVGNIGRLIESVSGVPYNFLACKASLELLSGSELKDVKIEQSSYGLSLTPKTSPGGKISKICGLDFLKNDPSIISYYLNKGIGDFVIPYPKGLEYLGEIVLVESDKKKFHEKTETLLNNFHIEYEV